VKIINWNAEKNALLKVQRGISFEKIELLINDGKLIDVVRHPNKEKYPLQKIMIIDVDGYAYLVPFVENETEIFLKTIIPSRKASKKYLNP